jgi:hypothetical protein
MKTSKTEPPPQDIESQLVAVIEGVVHSNVAGKWRDEHLTAELLSATSRLGESFRDPPLEISGWLYDQCWSRMSVPPERGFLERVVLALECELGIDLSPIELEGETVPALDGDFQKLVQSRASHRVWIFGDRYNTNMFKTAAQVNAYMDGCIQQIERFEGTVPDDRYLLIGLYANRTQVVSRLHVVPNHE